MKFTIVNARLERECGAPGMVGGLSDTESTRRIFGRVVLAIVSLLSWSRRGCVATPTTPRTALALPSMPCSSSLTPLIHQEVDYMRS